MANYLAQGGAGTPQYKGWVRESGGISVPIFYPHFRLQKG